ncbi:unnamed protein product, partial [marine sediment metagenome]
GDSVIYGIKGDFSSFSEWTNESIIDSYEITSEYEYKISISSFDENNKTCTTKIKYPLGFTDEYTRIYGGDLIM